MVQIIIGIDIGSYSIKVAELHRSFKSFEFTNFFERRIQYNEVLSPEESVASALQGVLEDNALIWEKCYAALPTDHITTRLIEMPFAPKKVAQTLMFEVEEHIPFEVDDIVLDHHVIEGGKNFSKLLVFYAKKSAVESTLTFLTNAGAEPRVLCALGVELVNLVSVGLSPPDVSYAILDVGHEKTVVTICRGKQLEYTRTISVGGRHITQAIADALDVSEEEAERLKIELGQVPVTGDLPEPKSIPNKVTRAIGEVMEELALSLRQTFFAYREQSNEVVEGIYLCGGSARLPGVDQYLSISMQQNVTFINCHDFHFTRVDQADCPPEPAAGCLALALRSVAASGMPSIDFRQNEFQYRADTEQVEGSFRMAAIAAGLVMLLGVTYFGMRWYSLSQQLAQRNQEIMRLVKQALPKAEFRKVKSADGAVSALQRVRKDTQKRIDALQELSSSSVLHSLKRFSEGVPKRKDVELDVYKYIYKLEQVKISAEAQSSADVDKIRTAVETALTEHQSADGKRKLPPGDGGEPMLVQFPPAKTGAKGELKFDLIMQSKAAAERAAKQKKQRRGRRRR